MIDLLAPRPVRPLMVAASEAETITFTIVGLVAALALIVFVYLTLRKERPVPPWWRFRVGFFVERVREPHEDEQTTGADGVESSS